MTDKENIINDILAKEIDEAIKKIMHRLDLEVFYDIKDAKTICVKKSAICMCIAEKLVIDSILKLYQNIKVDSSFQKYSQEVLDAFKVHAAEKIKTYNIFDENFSRFKH